MTFTILRMGEAARAALDELQRDIGSTQLQIKKTEDARVTADEMRVRLVERLKEEEARFSPMPWFEMFAEPNPWQGRPPTLELTTGFVITLSGGAEAVADRMMKLMSGIPGPDAISTAKRAQTLSALRTRLQELELREAREIVRLEDAGHRVLYRVDAKPKVFLRVWQEAPEEPAARVA